MNNCKQPDKSMLRNYDKEAIEIEYWIEFVQFWNCPSCGQLFSFRSISDGNNRCPHCAQLIKLNMQIS